LTIACSNERERERENERKREREREREREGRECRDKGTIINEANNSTMRAVTTAFVAFRLGRRQHGKREI
jgi:hypothetical protein